VHGAPKIDVRGRKRHGSRLAREEYVFRNDDFRLLSRQAIHMDDRRESEQPRDFMTSTNMHELIQIIEDEMQSRPTAIDLKWRTRHEWRLTGSGSQSSRQNNLRRRRSRCRGRSQLLDALGSLESADRRFQRCIRVRGRLQNHPLSANRLNVQAGKSERLRNV
jgi:hypothetical protein